MRLGSAPIGLKKSDWELRGLRRGAIGSGPSLLRDLTCTCKCLLRGHMGPAAASNGPPWELHPSTKKPTWRWCQLLRGLLGHGVHFDKTRLDLLPPPPGPSRIACLLQGGPIGPGAALPWDVWRGIPRDLGDERPIPMRSRWGWHLILRVSIQTWRRDHSCPVLGGLGTEPNLMISLYQLPRSAARMRLPHPVQRFVASSKCSTNGPSGTARRMRLPRPVQRFVAP